MVVKSSANLGPVSTATIPATADHDAVSADPRSVMRTCRYRDWSQLHRLIEECFPEMPASEIRYLLCRHMPGIRTMRYGSLVTGVTITYPTEDDGTAWLEMIGVSKHFRGKKLGAVLLNDLSNSLESLGYSRLRLAVNFDNGASLALFDGQDDFRRVSETERVTFEKTFPVPTQPIETKSELQFGATGRAAYVARLSLYFLFVKLPKWWMS